MGRGLHCREIEFFFEISGLQHEKKVFSSPSTSLHGTVSVNVKFIFSFISSSKAKSHNKDLSKQRVAPNVLQHTIRALTIEKKKSYDICLFSKVCTYIFLFKYIANI